MSKENKKESKDLSLEAAMPQIAKLEKQNNELHEKLNIMQKIKQDTYDNIRQNMNTKDETPMEERFFIYVCCCLQDDNVIRFLKDKIKSNKYNIWLNVNSYNVTGTGGIQHIDFYERVTEYLKIICEDRYIEDPIDARKNYKVYCICPNPVGNGPKISDYYNSIRVNKVILNTFGIKKFYNSLTQDTKTGKGLKCTSVGNGFKEVGDLRKVEKNDEVAKFINGDSKKEEVINRLIKLYNDSLDKLNACNTHVNALEQWRLFWNTNDGTNIIEKNKELITSFTDPGMGRIYTQIQKMSDAITLGPKLPHDHLGLLAASYINFTKMSPSHYKHIDAPVTVENNKVLNPVQGSNRSDFSSFLCNFITNFNTIDPLKFADIIYHDGEEDDILTIQHNKIKKPNFECIMQQSQQNAHYSQMYVTIHPMSFSMYSKPENFKNEDFDKHVMGNIDKVSYAAVKCVNTGNCFGHTGNLDGVTVTNPLKREVEIVHIDTNEYSDDLHKDRVKGDGTERIAPDGHPPPTTNLGNPTPAAAAATAVAANAAEARALIAAMKPLKDGGKKKLKRRKSKKRKSTKKSRPIKRRRATKRRRHTKRR